MKVSGLKFIKMSVTIAYHEFHICKAFLFVKYIKCFKLPQCSAFNALNVILLTNQFGFGFVFMNCIHTDLIHTCLV